MNTFFTELAEIMSEGQEMQLNVTKSPEGLTIVTIPNTKRGGHITAKGTTEDFDNEFISSMKKIFEEKPKFIMVASEPDAEEEEEEEGKEDSKDTAGSKAAAKKSGKKETATAKAKKGTVVKPDPKDGIEEATVPEETPNPKEEPAAPEKTEPKAEEKEEAAREQNKKTVFASIIKNAEKLEGERKWKEALAEYHNASAYYPEDKKCKEGIDRTGKWVERMAAIDL